MSPPLNILVKYHSLRALCPVMIKSHIVPKCLGAETCQRRATGFPQTTMSHWPRSAPMAPQRSHCHIPTKRLCPQTHKPDGWHRQVPEKCAVLCSFSLIVQRQGSEAYVQIWDNDMCYVLVVSNIVGHHVVELSSLKCSGMTFSHRNPHAGRSLGP